MSDKTVAKFIYERWITAIKSEDKRGNMKPTFEVLAADLFAAGVAFEIANDMLKQAAKDLYPNNSIIKKVYAVSNARKWSSLIEFTANWHKKLDETALASFYEYYDIEGIDPNKLAPTKKLKVLKQEAEGMVSDDELNQEDFWKSTKLVTKSNPWLFDKEDRDV